MATKRRKKRKKLISFPPVLRFLCFFAAIQLALETTELPMTNTRWQILDFRPGVTPRGFSGLKIGH
jgi:hypothetical protein